jgi:hypothetical protein
MILETTKKWIETLELDVESQVHADLALALAARYDDKGETSTAGELRKTLNELKSMLANRQAEPDELEQLLTR